MSAAFPDVRFDPTPPALSRNGDASDSDEAELVLVRSRVECIGPFTTAELARKLGMREGAVKIVLANMENSGGVLSGRFTPGRIEEEYCDRRILARIHRDTVARLRKQVEPVSSATFMRFLLRWQHGVSPWQVRDEGGLLEVIEQLQGFEAAAGTWETDVLPLRVADYRADMLEGAVPVRGGGVGAVQPPAHQRERPRQPRHAVSQCPHLAGAARVATMAPGRRVGRGRGAHRRRC